MRRLSHIRPHVLFRLSWDASFFECETRKLHNLVYVLGHLPDVFRKRRSTKVSSNEISGQSEAMEINIGVSVK